MIMDAWRGAKADMAQEILTIIEQWGRTLDALEQIKLLAHKEMLRTQKHEADAAKARIAE